MTTWTDVLNCINVNDLPSNSHTGDVYNTEIYTFSELLSMDCTWSDEFYNRMRKHWVSSWICTDTRVGIAVYCLDKIPVAVSCQPARKSKELIMFINNDSVERVRNCLMQFLYNSANLELVKLDEEIHSSFFELAPRQHPFSKLP